MTAEEGHRVVFDLKKVGEYRVEGVGTGSWCRWSPCAGGSRAPPRRPDDRDNSVGEVMPHADASAGWRSDRRQADFTIVDSATGEVIVEIAMRDLERDVRPSTSPQNRESSKPALPYTKGEARTSAWSCSCDARYRSAPRPMPTGWWSISTVPGA
jgi:hypothetical protein